MTSPLNRYLRDMRRQMRTLALIELERRARVVLTGNNPARQFYMGGGDAYFINAHGLPLAQGDTVHGSMKWADIFYYYLEEWDDLLKLSAHQMCITGPDDPVREGI